MLIAHFGMITWQNRIRQYFHIVTLPGMMSKESFDVIEGLEKVQDIISKYALQGPVSYRTQKAKTEYFNKAVVNMS